jgi:glycopeptide antibiotics resistance protein
MKKRVISAFVLVAYSAILIKLLVFKAVSFRIGHLMFNFTGGGPGPANFVPFKTIMPYLLGQNGRVIALFELGGNIGLLVPIGFIVPFVCRKMTWQKSVAVAVAAGLAIEGMQVLLRVGIFDVDDVMLNGLGVMIGYGLFAMVAGWVRARPKSS